MKYEAHDYDSIIKTRAIVENALKEGKEIRCGKCTVQLFPEYKTDNSYLDGVKNGVETINSWPLSEIEIVE